MKQHKHAELIKQWADGAEIEARAYIDGGWTTWTGTDTPTWNGTALKYEFRIKPEPKPDFYRYLRIIFDGETGKLKNAEVLK